MQSVASAAARWVTIWEPALSQIGAEDFTLHCFERMGEAGLVQESRLKPHSVSSGGTL